METEIMKSLKISPHLKKSKSSGGSLTNRAHYEYISLKNILESPRGRRYRRNYNSCGNELIPGIDTSTINISNPVVRHAATIYLQSAALIATRDQNFMDGVWLRQGQMIRCNGGCVGDFFGIVREYVVRFLASFQGRNVAYTSQ